MSVAEPADPTPPTMNTLGDAAVIDIRTRVGRQTTKGRGQRMNTPTPHTPSSSGSGAGSSEEASARALADQFETKFNEHHLSLTDARTAEAYTVTLRIVQHLLAGAQAHGVVDEEQRRNLHTMLEGVMGAPGMVGG